MPGDARHALNQVAPDRTNGEDRHVPVAEAALAYVAKKVLEQLEGELGGAASQQVRAWFKRDPQRLACEVALADTERRFAALHPDWHASLFDAHFLSTAAAPLLARSLRRGADASAKELAAAWANTVGGETGARHLDAVTPAAADLLDIWREELGRHAVFQPILDSKALDKLADAGVPAELERILLRARYPQLEDHIDWSSRRAARSLDAFVGREWAFEWLEQMAAKFRAAYLHVVADAGLGKTALAISVAARQGAPLYLFNEREGRARGDRCLNHLCAELIDRHGLEYDHLPAHAGEDTGMLERLLEEVPKPAWVVIDALDEAAAVPLPEELPDGAFVVLTHRPGGYGPAARPGTGQHELVIRADAKDQRDDLAAYLRRRAEESPVRTALATLGVTPTVFAERLFAASEGNFMYVAYVLGDLLDGAPLRLDALPRGLDRYYAQMWEEIAPAADREWDPLQRAVIEALAVAGEPVTPEWLEDVTGHPAHEIKRRALRPWRRFLSEDGGGWRIVHQSFRDFLGEELDLAGAHRVLAAHFRARRDGYASRHLAMHLRYAGELHDLLALVEEPDWRGAQLLADPSGALYREDVEHAWEAAFEADQRAITRGEQPPHLLREITCALTASEQRSFALALPPELLLRLLETGLWKQEQVLNAALSAPPEERLAALDMLLPALDGRAREEALQRRREALAERTMVELEELAPEELPALVDGMAALAGDAGRADALLDLAERMEGEQLDREIVAALRAVLRRDDLIALPHLAPRIPQRLLGQVLAAVLELDPELRDEHLADLAPRLDAELAAVALAHTDDVYLRGLLAAGLPEGERVAAGERALEAVAQDDALVRDVRLAQLADALPDALIPRALELADTDEALAALVPRLGEDGVRDAFARATGPWSLLALAPRLPDDLVRPAFDAAAACEGGEEAMAALAPRLPDEALPDALAAASASAPVLAPLAPRLSEAQLRLAIDRVGHDRHAVAMLAPHLPAPLLVAAVAAAGSSSERADALAFVAPYVRGAAEAALQADAAVHARARMAPHLPAPETHVRAALEALDELPAEERHDVAVTLLPHLSGEQRERALAHVDLSVVSSTDVEVLRDDLSAADVTRLLEQLDPDEDWKLLEALEPRLTLDVLQAALDKTEPEHRTELVLAVAPHLPAGDREAALGLVEAPEQSEEPEPEAWLEAAVAAGDWFTLEHLAPRVPPELLEPLIEPAAAIYDLDTRALALATLAAHLSGAARARAIAAIEGPLQYARPLLALGPDAAPLVPLLTQPGERAQVLAAVAPALGAAALHRQIHETLCLAAARGQVAGALAHLGPALGRLN